MIIPIGLISIRGEICTHLFVCPCLYVDQDLQLHFPVFYVVPGNKGIIFLYMAFSIVMHLSTIQLECVTIRSL